MHLHISAVAAVRRARQTDNVHGACLFSNSYLRVSISFVLHTAMSLQFDSPGRVDFWRDFRGQFCFITAMFSSADGRRGIYFFFSLQGQPIFCLFIFAFFKNKQRWQDTLHMKRTLLNQDPFTHIYILRICLFFTSEFCWKCLPFTFYDAHKALTKSINYQLNNIFKQKKTSFHYHIRQKGFEILDGFLPLVLLSLSINLLGLFRSGLLHLPLSFP